MKHRWKLSGYIKIAVDPNVRAKYTATELKTHISTRKEATFLFPLDNFCI